MSDFDIKAYQHIIHGTIYKKVGRTVSAVDIADIIQVTNLKLLDGAIDKFDPEKGTIEGFIYTVTHNVLFSYLRSGKRRSDLLSPAGDSIDSIGSATNDCTPLSSMLEIENLAAMRRGLAQLPEEDQKFLECILSGEYDFRAYSVVSGISEGALRVRKHKIIKKLKKLCACDDPD